MEHALVAELVFWSGQGRAQISGHNATLAQTEILWRNGGVIRRGSAEPCDFAAGLHARV